MAAHKTPTLIARTTLEGTALANIVTEDGILVATVVNDEWTKILVTACNNHDHIKEKHPEQWIDYPEMKDLPNTASVPS